MFFSHRSKSTVPGKGVIITKKRRSFSAPYKKKILAEVEAAAGTGNIGEILRREGIYSSTLTSWRKERDAAVDGAFSRKRGPSRNATCGLTGCLSPGVHPTWPGIVRRWPSSPRRMRDSHPTPSAQSSRIADSGRRGRDTLRQVRTAFPGAVPTGSESQIGGVPTFREATSEGSTRPKEEEREYRLSDPARRQRSGHRQAL
jgi:hypothetical protein